MKKTLLAVSLALISSVSVAQSNNVTLYGIVDAGMRTDTSANADGASRTQMISGGQSPSLFGIRGTEDLGNGLSAKFRLESGFLITNGTLNQSGSTGTVLFDRQAWVGLADKTAGEVQLGRNTTAAWDQALAGVTDPLRFALEGAGVPVVVNNATYGVNALRVNQVSTAANSTNGYKNSRSDGMIKYLNSFGPVAVTAGYAPGGVTGSDAKASYNLGAVVSLKDVKLGANTFSAKDASSKELKQWAAGGNYQIGKTTLTASYTNIQTDAGYVAANLTTTATYAGPVLGTTATTGPSTEAKIMALGVKYDFTPKISSTLAFYNGNYSNGVGSSGNLKTYALFNTYALSKRTNLYGSLDFADADGALTSSSVKNTNTGITVGMRHFF
jgi:predicted porin